MSDVKIEKVNELKLRVIADKNVQREMFDHFTFFAPNFKFMPLYKQGLWDGKIKMFDWRNCTIDHGLLVDVVKFCKRYGYRFTISDDLKINSFSAEIESYRNNVCNYTNKSVEGKYSYQWEYFAQAMSVNKATILSPTASGKSHIVYLFVRFLLEQTTGAILITVPNVSLVVQLYSDFKDYVNDEFSVDDNVHLIHSGATKTTDKRVVISTWAALIRSKKPYFKRFESYICDEVHQADGKSITGIVEKLEHTKYRFGFTGTLNDAKTHEMKIRGMFGPIVKVTDTKELMEQGVLSGLKIDVNILRYPSVVCDAFSSATYQEELDFIISNKERNDFIVEQACSQSNNVLVLFNFVHKHGLPLFKEIKKRAKGKQVYFVCKDTDIAVREEARGYSEQNNNTIIVASFGTFATGVNIKNLHVIIFAQPYKAKIRILQSIGRGLRLHNSKKSATLIDIIDDLSYNKTKKSKRKNFTLLHGMERLKRYQESSLEYNIEILEVDK